MESIRTHRDHFIEVWLPWLVLLILGFLTLSIFVFFPYAGFDISYDQIVLVYSADPPGDNLEVGDRIIQVGSMRLGDYFSNRWQPVFSGVEPGEVVPMRVERGGKVIDIAWIFPGMTSAQLIENLMGLWWLGFVFWLAGTSTVLFIRPRDTIWRLLIAFYYLTAVWMLAGSGPSRWHVLGGAIILRMAAWMFAPVCLHLNWLFPRPLGRLPARFWQLLYALTLVLAVAEVFSILPESAYMVGLAIGGAGIILLLLAHVIFQPAYRKYITPLAVGALIAVLPALLVLLRDLFGLPSSPSAPGVIVDLAPSLFIYSASALGIAALPGIYFYSVYILQFGGPTRRVWRLVRIYLFFILASACLVFFFAFFLIGKNTVPSRSVLGILLPGMALLISVIGLFPLLALPVLQTSEAGGASMEHPQLRANRLVSLYLYFVLVLAILGSLGILLSTNEELPYGSGWITLAVSVLAVVTTIFVYPRFQLFVDRRILGIPVPPTHLFEAYSSRITTSLEPASLVSLLRDELLPSLLVRQSALIQVTSGGSQVLYASGLGDEQPFTTEDLQEFLRTADGMEAGGWISLEMCRCPWVKLLLPLRVESKLVGIWLLGRRDPDDSYERGEVGVLQAVANQTAIALINIQQSERLHALYQADMDRQEAERADLALFLHDQVLNALVGLSMQIEPGEASSKFGQGFQALIDQLREAVRGLRPAMLNYGLYTALEELVDELGERAGENLSVRVQLEPLMVRYDEKVEQHLYRIIEQACENVLRHAHCRELLVCGKLEPDRVEIEVIDDGVGLPAGMELNISQLLLEGHYGLVGMYERAALVGAELHIVSSPGNGTRLQLSWKEHPETQ